jgi:UDP-glucose 4-epimerase
MQMFGDGGAVRDFVYIDDVVDAFRTAIYSSAQGVLNISSGVGVAIADIVAQLEAITGLTARIRHLPARPSDPRAVVLSNRLAASQLDWQPRVAFPEGLMRTVAALRDGAG